MSYSDRLNKVIPGGAHTYSRGDDQFPSNAPEILSSGKGAFVQDVDGNEFLDYGMGLRSITMGYANEEINQAAIQAINAGNNLTRASLVELEAAEMIVELIPSADMVKFAKNGSTVTSAAVKLARGYTGRNYIARCAQHPFFSYDDWFIGDTNLKKGIPENNFTLQFEYGNIESVKKLFSVKNNDIACIILEPCTALNGFVKTKDDIVQNEDFKGQKLFLEQLRQLCDQHNTVLIFDEMITGFRWDLKGAQEIFQVVPDLTTFGKGMANGFSVAALTGKRDIMELGSIKSIGTERLFLISTTHGAEMSGLAAFSKTVEIYKRDKVVDHLWNYGIRLMEGVNNISKELGLENHFQMNGYPCSPNYITFDKNKEASLAFRTLFSQEMIKSKVLMPWVSICFSHNENTLSKTLEACRRALNIYKQALDEGINIYLQSETIKPVFRQYN